MYGNVNRKKKKDGTLYKDYYYYHCKHRTTVNGHKCGYRRQWKQEMVDDGKMKFIPAVSLSFLTKEEQSWVFRCIIENSISVSGAMADAMKKYSENGKLTEITVQLILCEEKKDTGKVTIPANRISRYFPKDYSKQQMEQVIFELLEDWKKKH